MASYPVSVFSPASKSAGDTIQPAHINDLDSEVAAVEEGLLNGLNHALTVSTGGLTVSTGNVIFGQNLSVAAGSTFTGAVVMSSGLSVAGGSTFTGSMVASSNLSVGKNLNVAGKSTLTGTLQLDGAVTLNAALTLGGSGSLPAASRARSAKVTVAATVAAAIGSYFSPLWNTQTHTTAGMHSTATNSSRIALNSSGVWMCGAQLELSQATGGSTLTDMRVRVMLNDATSLGAVKGGVYPPAVHALNVTCGPHIATTTGDYITMQGYRTQGSTMSVLNSTQYGSYLWAYKVSD